MFWDSVWKGFLVLLQWKIWIFVAVYSLITYLHYSYVIKRIANYDITVEGIRGVINSYSILKTVIDTFLVVVTTFFIFPILAGSTQLMPFSDVKATLKIIFIITLVIAGSRIILIALSRKNMGEFFKPGSNMTSFFVCMLLIYFMSHEIFGQLPEEIRLPQDSYPGFFTCLGFVLLTFPVVILFSLGLGIIMMPLSKEVREFITNAISIAVVFIMGIVYMRMYCAYIMGNLELNYNSGEVSEIIGR